MLGPVSLVGLGIGCIVGAGIFVLTGKAAASYAGPAISLSVVLSGIACAFVGLCYAELGAMIPASGSAYTYAYAAVGEIFAWIIGRDLILEYGICASTVALGWSRLLHQLAVQFRCPLPADWVNATGGAVKLANGRAVAAVFNLPAALIVAALTLLLMLGTREATRVNNIMVGFKQFVVAAVCGGGDVPASRYWVSFIPPNIGSFGWSRILRGASVVFFAYMGSIRFPPGRKRLNGRSGICRSASWGS